MKRPQWPAQEVPVACREQTMGLDLSHQVSPYIVGVFKLSADSKEKRIVQI